MRSVALLLRLTTLLTVLAAVAASGLVATPAAADPGEDRGSPASLREQLESAAKGYLDAKAALQESQKRQKQLTAELTAVETGMAEQDAAVAELARHAYKSAGLGPMSSLLDSGSPTVFLDRVTMLGAIAAHEEEVVRDLAATRDRVAKAKADIDAEVKKQREQVAQMGKRKQQAEAALRAAGGGQATSSPGGSSGATAAAAPRNRNGTWPAQGCTVNDPTTSGCITPRMNHAMQQAVRAGFTRYKSCYRGSGSGEHPKGRACDFAAQKGGFGGTATGGDRTYGNNLAAYFVKNASRLGVLYVIWFRKIWLPGSGWRSYQGSGDPSSNHENHVHLSVY